MGLNRGAPVGAAAAEFGLARPASIAVVGGGHIHRSWVVSAGPRSLLLQWVNTTIFADIALLQANTVRVTDHLRARGAVVAEPVAAGDGRLWWSAPDGGVWRAFVHLPDVRSAEPVHSAAEAEEVGRAFGRFAALMADLPGPALAPTLPHFHDLGARWAECQEAAGRAAAEDATASAIFATLTGFASLAGAFAGLPDRVAHGDAKAGNVLLDAAGGAARAVVDLDTVGPAPLLVDAGDLVRSATCAAAEDEVDPARVAMDDAWLEAVLRGWLGRLHEVLSDEEVERLIVDAQAICWEQAARFLTDHFDGDRYYGAGRRGHNLDRARNQVRLLEQLASGRRSYEGLVARVWRGGP